MKGGKNSHKGNDDYSQAGALFRLLPLEERVRMTAIIAATLKSSPEATQRKVVDNFRKCDPQYGSLIAQHLGFAHEPSAAGVSAHGAAARVVNKG